MPKSIRICDTVLMKVEKSDKLSPNFRPRPFKVDQKTWTEVTVRNDDGDEFIRNTAFIKKYNEQDSVSRPVGKENSSPQEIEQREKVVTPMMTGGSGNSPVPLQSSPGKGGETESQMQTASPLISQQTVCRSLQIVKKPERLGDFVLSLRR